VNKHGLKIITLHVIPPTENGKNDLVVHVDSEDASKVVDELKGKGYEVTLRKR